MAEVSKIDYKLGQDNVQLLGLDIHNPVFVVSSLTIIAFVAGVLVFQAGAAAAFGALRPWLHVDLRLGVHGRGLPTAIAGKMFPSTNVRR